jgi:N-acetylglucosamine-6-phosphate deacetylase
MSDLHRHAVAATTVFDGTRTHADSAVVVEGSRIVWLGPRKQLPSGVPVHTLPEGAWLAPGFIDIQVNGGGDVLFNADPTAAALARIAAAHRRFGTTALLATLISDTAEKMRAALDAVGALPADCGVLGVHLEGPFLSPQRPGVHDPAMIRRPTAQDLDLMTSGKAGVRVVTLAPEQVPAGFIAALVRAGVRAALGHSMATYTQTKAALSEGLTGFTHLFNAMRPLESREPGPIAAALESPGAFFGMIVDGAHVHPAMLKLALRGAAHPVLVTDAMPPVGGRAPGFSLHGRRIEIKGVSCVTGDGTLAGSALDMASAVRNSVRLLDIPLTTALRYASAEPARFLGLDHGLGKLAVGYRADMLALEPANVRVLGTWIGGGWAQASDPSSSERHRHGKPGAER